MFDFVTVTVQICRHAQIYLVKALMKLVDLAYQHPCSRSEHFRLALSGSQGVMFLAYVNYLSRLLISRSISAAELGIGANAEAIFPFLSINT